MPIQLTPSTDSPSSNNERTRSSTGNDLVPSTVSTSESQKRDGSSGPGASATSQTSQFTSPSTAQLESGHEGGGQVGSAPLLTREEADRLYEERMEDEYAKREGGA